MNRVNKILNNRLFRLHMQELKEAEKERKFCKHGIDHLLSVARIMRIKSLEQGIEINPEIIYASALLHDIGRGNAYRTGDDHAKESAKISEIILPECGFERAEIEHILFAILHHNDEVTADDLCRLMRTADKLSRNCFDCPAYVECNWKEEEKNKGVEI